MTLRKWDHFVIYEPRKMRNMSSSKDFSYAWRTRMYFYLKKPFPPHVFAYLWPVCSISHPTQTEFSSQISSSSPQQINTVNLTHTPSSEPSQNKANKRTRGPWRGLSTERQAVADTCRSRRPTESTDTIITGALRNFKQYSSRMDWWIHCYCFEFLDEKHDNVGCKPFVSSWLECLWNPKC